MNDHVCYGERHPLSLPRDTLAANQVNGVGLMRSSREYVQMLLHVLFATIPHSPTDPTPRWEP